MAKQATAYHNVTPISSQPRGLGAGRDLEQAISQTKDEPPFVNNDRIAANTRPPVDAFAFDTLSARIKQARATLVAVQSTWDDEDGKFGLTPKFIYQALWGIEELLDQGISAAETMAAAE